ncbi:MAG TPA: hypothetical protein VIJ38_05785, partial [Acidobacteriaceae bacterium]
MQESLLSARYLLAAVFFFADFAAAGFAATVFVAAAFGAAKAFFAVPLRPRAGLRDPAGAAGAATDIVTAGCTL